MTFLKFKAVFTDEENGMSEEVVDDISINIEEISSFNPSTDRNNTTVSLKNGQRYELVIQYQEFSKMLRCSGERVLIMHTDN